MTETTEEAYLRAPYGCRAMYGYATLQYLVPMDHSFIRLGKHGNAIFSLKRKSDTNMRARVIYNVINNPSNAVATDGNLGSLREILLVSASQ